MEEPRPKESEAMEDTNAQSTIEPQTEPSLEKSTEGEPSTAAATNAESENGPTSTTTTQEDPVEPSAESHQDIKETVKEADEEGNTTTEANQESHTQESAHAEAGTSAEISTEGTTSSPSQPSAATQGESDSPLAPPVPDKSPSPKVYTLPIGGGPKKVVIMPPIRNSSSTVGSTSVSKDNKSESVAPLSPTTKIPEDQSTPSTSPSSVRSRMQRLRSASSPPVGLLLPLKSPKRRMSATVQSQKMPGLVLSNDSPSLIVAKGTASKEKPTTRRRAQSASNVVEANKAVKEGEMGRKRASTVVGKVTVLQRSLSDKSPLGSRRFTDHAPITRPMSTLSVPRMDSVTKTPARRRMTTSDIRTPPRRRRMTASSVLMVEGQMFEINDGEEEEEKVAPPLSVEEEIPEDDIYSNVDTASRYDNDEEVDDYSVIDEPMIYTDEEIDDVPPPGAYAIHPPSKTRLAKAAELSLYDEDGKIVEFGSIFEGRRTLICFLRHWLCPFCQMFSQSLQAIDPLPLETANLGLVVIGQGHWHVTKSYKEVMKIPKFVQMYSDPSRKIYKALGMTLRTNDAGPACARPDYQTMGVFKASMVAIKKGVFDMPLRMPGDLMLLGGEFILGPGLQCSFTHRMVTTRGHLDLPRILVQAGCDLSLKSPPVPGEELKRPGSTKSVDHITARRLARKLVRRNKGSAGISNKDFNANGDRTNTLRALSGQHESQRGRRSLAKRRKQPPLPDIRNLNISYPMPTDYSEQRLGSPASLTTYAIERMRSVPEPEENNDSTIHQGLVPPSPTSPLRIVKDRISTGMVTGFSKSSSMGDMNNAFSRPPRSVSRPPVPPTSSAEAFAAAAARTHFHPSQPSPTSNRFLTSPSMPTLTGNNQSTTSLETIQPRNQTLHQRMPTQSSSDSNNYSRSSETAFSASSHGSNHSTASLSRADLKDSYQTSLVSSNSLKRSGNQSAGVPLSVLEKRAMGSPRAATFSSSSPGLPLSSSHGDATRSKTATLKTPTQADFGEDTEYKRLDRKVLEQPKLPSPNGSGSDDPQERGDVPRNHSNGKKSHRERKSNGSLSPPTPPEKDLVEVDEDLQRTPLARKISLEPGEYGAGSEEVREAGPRHREAVSAQTTMNRASIMQADPVPAVTRNFSPPKASPMSPSPSFAQNALFAGLPPQINSHLPSTRAPMPAPTPVFASILAEEAARVRQINQSEHQWQSNGHPVKWNGVAAEGKASPLPSAKPAKRSQMMGNSFLDDMDVHDGFRSHQAVTDTVSNARSSGADFDESDEDGEEEEEEEEDDWAPLQASGNAVPARISDESERQSERSGDEGDSSYTESSDRSPDEDDDDDYEDVEGEEATTTRRSTSSSSGGRQDYILKQVTNRVSSQSKSAAPVLSSRPRKIHNKAGLRLYKPDSMTGLRNSTRRLDSFREEEEEEQSEGDTSGMQTPT